MMERKLGPLPSLFLLQNRVYNMSLNYSTSTMVTTGGPLRPEFGTHHATEEEISANQVRNQSLWTHDEAFDLNLPGRLNADVETRKDGMSLHKGIKIATWNVRSLKSIGKLSVVCKEMERHNISVLGLAEVHWTGRGSFVTADGCKVIYSRKELGEGYNHGVGIILNKFVSKTVLGYHPVNDRIITVRLKAHPYNVTVVQFYSPTSDATIVEVETFYDILQETLDSIPNRDIKVKVGDANSKIGRMACASATHGKYGLGEQNEQGQRLLEFCTINNLIVTNTLFQHHPRRLYTYRLSPDHRTKNQIDYIIVPQRWRSSVKNTRTYPGADCNSDHQLHVMNFKLRLKKNVQQQSCIRFDLTATPNEYSVEISNRFELLARLDEEKTPNELWTDIKVATIEVAKKLIPKIKKRKQKWISSETYHLIEERRMLKAKGLDSSEMQERYQQYNREIQKALRHDKKQNIIKQCEEIENNSKQNATRDLYRAVKNITRRFNPRLEVVKDDSNNVLTDGSDVLNRWKEYCEKLYEHPNRDSECPIEINSMTYEPPPLFAEVEKALYSLKNNKSPGYDDIPAELLKIPGESAVKVMYKLCIKIWKQCEWPEDWLASLFVIIPKKGDTMKCENNRTNALICHASKVLLKIMAQRMKVKLKEEIAEEQGGFISEKGTRNQIMNLKLIIEKYREYNKALYICFIDYRKAFDAVSHNKLWQIMCNMGFPQHLLKLLQSFVSGSKSNSLNWLWFNGMVFYRARCQTRLHFIALSLQYLL